MEPAVELIIKCVIGDEGHDTVEILAVEGIGEPEDQVQKLRTIRVTCRHRYLPSRAQLQMLKILSAARIPPKAYLRGRPQGGGVDSVRYYIALIMVIAVTPALTFWLIVHPFVRFWRRFGPVWTLSLVWGAQAVGMLALFQVRKPILATEFGTNYGLVVLGVGCIVAATVGRVKLSKHLSVRTIAGLPELAPGRYPQKLLTEGVYARIRHPRYVQFLLALLGYALIANYLALYVVCAAWVGAAYLIVLFEERELRDRFGEAYDEYSRRVPRFVPRWRA
jgi:protein-S-isoprenylcysteine O-methyltransferase Ste14